MTIEQLRKRWYRGALWVFLWTCIVCAAVLILARDIAYLAALMGAAAIRVTLATR